MNRAGFPGGGTVRVLRRNVAGLQFRVEVCLGVGLWDVADRRVQARDLGATVVQAIFLVILFDSLFAIWFMEMGL